MFLPDPHWWFEEVFSRTHVFMTFGVLFLLLSWYPVRFLPSRSTNRCMLETGSQSVYCSSTLSSYTLCFSVFESIRNAGDVTNLTQWTNPASEKEWIQIPVRDCQFAVSIILFQRNNSLASNTQVRVFFIFHLRRYAAGRPVGGAWNSIRFASIDIGAREDVTSSFTWVCIS